MTKKGHPGDHPGGIKPEGHPGDHPGGHPGGKPGGTSGGTGGGIDFDALTDTREKGAEKDGKRQALDARLFCQLLVFTGVEDTEKLIGELRATSFDAALYADMGDAKGVGLFTMHRDPDFFVTELRDFLNTSSFSKLKQRHRYTMLGRTYAIGHEENLEDWLLHRTIRVATTPEWKWAVYYPLRRTGEFAKLPSKDQGEILMEHGMIGRAFGKADLGHDIRLSCYGIDKNDNDFVIGLLGKELHPLSVLVQTMRKTKQTSTYIAEMGPFFVGKVVYQSSGKS